MEPILRIGRAKPTSEHLNAIIGLIDEAREWLPSKGTNQWSEAWPDKAQRDARVHRGLELGATWVAWERMPDKDILAATVTVTGKPNPAVWSPLAFNLAERTVYAHRLITARRYAGWDLGGDLLDWIGWRGRRNYGARWIRIDVWTSNVALHGYYMKRGFEQCGTCHDETYPSGVLLQRPVPEILVDHINPQFVESDDVPEAFSAAGEDDPAYAPYALPDVDATRLIHETPADLDRVRISEASSSFAEHTERELLAATA
jgi:hypothetical protein